MVKYELNASSAYSHVQSLFVPLFDLFACFIILFFLTSYSDRSFLQF